MSRRSKGVRLWLREARYNKAGKLTHAPTWFVLDGFKQVSTQLRVDASEDDKKEALRDYLTARHVEDQSNGGSRDPSEILIDDIVEKYIREVVLPSDAEPETKLGLKKRKRHTKKRPGHANPGDTARRLEFILEFFGGHVLDYVNGDTCDDYVEQRSTDAAARRELEDFRSAINHHRKRGLHNQIVSVSLPQKGKSRELWFDRGHAAKAIWAAWRYKDVSEKNKFVGINTVSRDGKTWRYAWRNGPRLYSEWGTPEFEAEFDEAIKNRPPIKYLRRHVAHFMVFARYMGSRPGVICATSIEPRRPKGLPWCDLERGIFYGLPEGQRETKKRRQKVRIPGPLLAHLRRWRRLGYKYVVEFRGEPVLRITKAHDATIAEAALGPEYTPHIWRHTVATWLMQAGADPWKAAQFLAMSLETLLRVYGHHRPDDSALVHQAFHTHRKTAAANALPMISANGR